MKTLLKITAILFIGMFIISCSGGGHYKEKEMIRQDSLSVVDKVMQEQTKQEDSLQTSSNSNTENKGMSSSAAVDNPKDTTHKFIRTADIKFRVKDVIKSTYKIEEIVKHFDGFVTSTSLSSNVEKTNVIPVRNDSSLETTYYTVQNSMVLRVPNYNLDTTLKSLAKLVDFMDYRNINAEDIAMKILENKLAQKRNQKYISNVDAASQTKSKDATETVNTQERLLDKEAAADRALLNNLTIADKIKYSTISLLIYQRQSIRSELIANEKNISAYEPGLGTKLLNALKFGWDMFMALIVFLIKLWALFLFAIIAYLIYKVLRRLWKKNK
ncbi:MAG TPA: DUF4349 domain-containing protein [Bacteroidales bacterium]|nr:DUF4349 domain-containing protein [Bacteroidales bacterium]HPS16852.1 DUF4349 domain-containing protein [Bacteroidales bacterium]